MKFTFYKEPWKYITVDNFLDERDLNDLMTANWNLSEMNDQKGLTSPTYILRNTVTKTIRKKYESKIKKIYQLLSLGEIEEYMPSCFLQKRPNGWTPIVHTDGQTKLLSCVLYLTEEDPKNSGTVLYNEDLSYGGYVEPVVNKLFCFCAHIDNVSKYHSAGFINGKDRISLNYILSS